MRLHHILAHHCQHKIIIKYFKNILIVFSVLFFSFFNTNIVFADKVIDKFNSGLNVTAYETGHVDGNGATVGMFANKKLPEVIGSTIGILLSLLGVFFLILMIYAGYTWMIARGSATETEKAKNTIINAVIGLVIVTAAYAITNYIAPIIIGIYAT